MGEARRKRRAALKAGTDPGPDRRGTRPETWHTIAFAVRHDAAEAMAQGYQAYLMVGQQIGRQQSTWSDYLLQCFRAGQEQVLRADQERLRLHAVDGAAALKVATPSGEASTIAVAAR